MFTRACVKITPHFVIHFPNCQSDLFIKEVFNDSNFTSLRSRGKEGLETVIK